MKRIFFILLLFIASSAIASNAPIQIRNKGQHGTHGNIPMPADQPNVYYNNDTRTIIIDGGGEVNYYDVEIMSLTTFDVVISTQVNGYYDTIDISSLPDGEYAITIDAPTGNSFEGRLDKNIKD